MPVEQKSEGEGLLSIQAIIVMSKSGIPVFENRFDKLAIDGVEFEPTLVAGVSSALSMYMDEFTADTKYGFETLKKSGVTMSSFKTELSSIIIVSQFDLPQIIIEQIHKAQNKLDNVYRSKFDGSDRSRDYLDPEIVYQTFDQVGFKLGIKKNLILDKNSIADIRYVRSIGPNLRFNLGSLREVYDKLPRGENLVTVNQVKSHFEAKKLDDKLIANLLVLAYQHHLIKYTNNNIE